MMDIKQRARMRALKDLRHRMGEMAMSPYEGELKKPSAEPMETPVEIGITVSKAEPPEEPEADGDDFMAKYRKAKASMGA